jgi:hypothetical protein
LLITRDTVELETPASFATLLIDMTYPSSARRLPDALEPPAAALILTALPCAVNEFPQIPTGHRFMGGFSRRPGDLP